MNILMDIAAQSNRNIILDQVLKKKIFLPDSSTVFIIWKPLLFVVSSKKYELSNAIDKCFRFFVNCGLNCSTE
jgi:hypothetical protein